MGAATTILACILGLLGGFYARQVWNRLLLIESVVRQLRLRQDEERPVKAPPMTYAEPLDMNSMTDEERIAFLNR